MSAGLISSQGGGAGPIVEHLSGEGGVDPSVAISPLDGVAYLTNTAGDTQSQDFTLADSLVDGRSIRIYNMTGGGGGNITVTINGGSSIEMLSGEHLGLTWDAASSDWVSDGIELREVTHDGTLNGNGSVSSPLTALAAVIFDDAVPAGPGDSGVNIRSNRALNQSPIDNTKTQITNLGSQDGLWNPGATGATGIASTIGGGDDNSAGPVGYETVGGGAANTASGDTSTVSGGFENVASGVASTVVGGDGCTASGDHAVAGGLGATASGGASTAFGEANATNDGAFAGGGSLASGLYSTALGTSTASGEAATALGNGCTASGDFSLAAGNGCNAINENAVALGNGCTASGPDGCIAAGNGCIASGGSSTAFGNGSLASGDSSFAAGNGASATNDNAVALGDGASATGVDSVALGNGVASGTRAFATNSGVAAGIDAAALGGSLAPGNVSTGLCDSSRALREAQLATASGSFTTAGDSQTSVLVLRGSTPGAGAGESVALQFGGGSGPATTELILEDGRGYTITVTASARGDVAAVANVQSFRRMFAVRRTAGLTVIAASGVMEQIGDAASVTWTLALTVGAAPDRLVLTFTTGITTSNVRIAADVSFVEVAAP